MRLWGKVVSGSLLLIAVVFLIVAIAVREARATGLAATAICVAVALFGVPPHGSRSLPRAPSSRCAWIRKIGRAW